MATHSTCRLSLTRLAFPKVCRVGASLVLLGSMGTISGCCARRDLVEAELRYQNRQVRTLKRNLCQREAEVQTLHTIIESGAGTGSCAPGGAPCVETPEAIYQKTAMSRVSLGMSTGPRDIDRDGAAEAVQFTVVCHDTEGDAFKCPGNAKLELAAFQENGVITSVASWDVDQEKLRETWKSSVLSAGYQVVIPAPVLDKAKKWRAAVLFQTLDGRVFRDERDFTYAPGGMLNLSVPTPDPPGLEFKDKAPPALEQPPRLEEETPVPVPTQELPPPPPVPSSALLDAPTLPALKLH